MMNKSYTTPDEMGFYGDFGGAFIPELLRENIEELLGCFSEIKEDEVFQDEFKKLLKDYVGRPTPLYFSQKLSTSFVKSLYSGPYSKSIILPYLFPIRFSFF